MMQIGGKMQKEWETRVCRCSPVGCSGVCDSRNAVPCVRNRGTIQCRGRMRLGSEVEDDLSKGRRNVERVGVYVPASGALVVLYSALRTGYVLSNVVGYVTCNLSYYNAYPITRKCSRAFNRCSFNFSKPVNAFLLLGTSSSQRGDGRRGPGRVEPNHRIMCLPML